MRLSESTRSLQQCNEEIGENAFVAGGFLNIIPIGPNKVDDQIWQTMVLLFKSTYIR